MDLTFNPETDFKWLLAVPLIPLCGYVIQIFFGRFLPRKGDWLLTTGMAVTMAITVWMAFKAIAATQGGEGFFHESLDSDFGFRWLYATEKGATDPLNVTAGILYDGLGAAMLAVVGIVSFFVHLFSTGYMHGDRRYHIFFANISLFTVAMLGLVLSDNILFLFVFWEIMGLMSYLLIGHFSHDPNSHRIKQAAAACKKAFLTTRVGDTCLLVGIMIFYYHFQTFRFTELWEAAQTTVAANGGEYPAWMTAAGLLVFGGTVGKSAQFPLHIWLPDAMEGPTPVSAMIHAATMVAAGVFLLGRTYPLMSPTVLNVVTCFGTVTALFAATIGMTVFDIKGVLAYSTISQLGFMVAGIGTGGIGLIAGLFHMVTHAFFKACLFLSAGSVIHGCHHEQDMRKMGGLRKKMPITFACMLICTCAISGIPLFSGFYSKDKIIQSAFLSTDLFFQGSSVFAAVALVVAAMFTAFYMFRLIFMTFFGEPKDHHVHDHAHESPPNITIALGILAFFGLLGGKFWLRDLDVLAHHAPWFAQLNTLETLYPGVELQNTYMGVGEVALEHAEHAMHLWAMVASLFVAAAGIFGAVWIYGLRKVDPARITGALGEVYVTVREKYYIDEFVNATVIRGTMVLSKVQRWIDETIVDGIVVGTGKLTRSLGFVSAWIDKRGVDGAVNGVGALAQAFGSAARLFQTGRIQQYVSFAVGGALMAAAWLILK
ncbi:MAG: NADH-quinone oxidoreductase subunit L [Planctomycetes bacterium]|nr:NADH-quinone oxidoreductase subunit L [Planctomycetota bacterium]